MIHVAVDPETYKTLEAEWLIDQISGLVDEKLTLLVSDVAEKRRILPKGTPFPGPWDNSKTPYLVEFMDDCSETSSIEVSVCMKGHQLGYTSAIENVIIYIIDSAPGPILYTTASDPLGKEWSENRFDPMIEQAGMQNLIFSQTRKKNSKKTGDKTLLKEFPGGRIKIAGYGSTSAFRSSSYRYFFGDEIDEASADLKNQGNALEQAEGRTSAYKTKRKIILFSTPVELDSSNVYKAYLLGDQRKYFVPCPHCGFMQQLEFKYLKYDRDKDGLLDVESVRYECQEPECGEYFYNYHKAEMYSSGKCEWRPTAKAKRANYRSRHMSCLYSPPGMITWTDTVQKYLDALDSGDPGLMKTFETLYLGWPYQEKGEAPPIQRVYAHRSNYPQKEVPKEVLFLTLGADVHGDNIVFEVCGHGRQFKTWSIDYVVIEGETDNSSSGAWAEFKERFLNGDFVYAGPRGRYVPQMAFIDSGYRGDVVVSFCETLPGLSPIKGFEKLGKDYQKKYNITKTPGSIVQTVQLNTTALKDIAYTTLRTERLPGRETPPQYPSFPYSYDDKYFKELNAEFIIRKRSANGKVEHSYYCPQGKPNHALDCRVYNHGAQYVLMGQKLEEDLKEALENYTLQTKKKPSGAVKVEFFYAHMEKIGVF